MSILYEGDKCPKCERGVMSYAEDERSCYCHVVAPCSVCCKDYPPTCNECGYEEIEEIEKKTYLEPSPPKIKTYQELMNKLTDGEFGYFEHSNGGWGNAISGKYPEGMTQGEILSKCGIDKYGVPHFKWFGDGTFEFSYNYN